MPLVATTFDCFEKQKNTINFEVQMKKIFSALFVILFAACLSVVPTSLTAKAETQDIYFVEPSAIAACGNFLFVADSVDDGTQSILHCFALSDGTDGKTQGQPTHVRTLDNLTDGVITGLSASNYALAADTSEYVGSLYVLTGNVATLYNVKTDGSLVAAADDEDFAYTTISAEGLADVCIGKYLDDLVPYYLTTELKYYQKANKRYTIAISGKTNSAKCFAYGDYVYFVFDGICQRYNGKLGEFQPSDTFNDENNPVKMSSQKVAVGGYAYTAFDGTEGCVALYDNKNIFGVVDNQQASKVLLATDEITVEDVAASNYGVYALDSNNQVWLYAMGENGYAKTSAFVGSDTVSIAPPTAFTSFTLAVSTGYPTNIVYKTSDETTSIESVKKNFNNTEYVVLGYDGDENSAYYYVLVGEKFGWIKKSPNATIQTDEKAQVIDTAVSQDLKYIAKFASLNTAYVYNLPFESSGYTEVSQKATDMKTVTLLQKFDRNDTQWYYVSYPDGEQTKFGFVKKNALGEFSVDGSSKTDLVLIKGEKKINASLFEAVKLYATADLTAGTEMYNGDSLIKLYSGRRVSLVKTSGDAAEIIVIKDDGSTEYGWIAAKYLIDGNKITSNAVAGLVFLSVAVVLGVVLLVLFKIRKDKKDRAARNVD